MEEIHVLGGRPFVALTETTVEHDLYFHGLAGRAGLRFEKWEEESAEEFAGRILEEVIQSGQTLDLLGCLLVPKEIGVEGWSPEEGRKTAAFIGQLRGDEDKARVRALILSLLIGFFGCGLASIRTSPRSSSGRPDKKSDTLPTDQNETVDMAAGPVS
jgi:hypothetical protein